eukprot:907201-Pyramimonas_sp.AAC.1
MGVKPVQEHDLQHAPSMEKLTRWSLPGVARPDMRPCMAWGTKTWMSSPNDGSHAPSTYASAHLSRSRCAL